jgi:hypothetical protein
MSWSSVFKLYSDQELIFGQKTCESCNQLIKNSDTLRDFKEEFYKFFKLSKATYEKGRIYGSRLEDPYIYTSEYKMDENDKEFYFSNNRKLLAYNSVSYGDFERPELFQYGLKKLVITAKLIKKFFPSIPLYYEVLGYDGAELISFRELKVSEEE